MRTTRAIALALLLGLPLASCSAQSEVAVKEGTPGITEKACPNAVNKNHGCIYLGFVTDQSSANFKALATIATEAQRAFWHRVNLQGGIGGYDIDATSYVLDNGYDPAKNLSDVRATENKVFAYAQMFGSVPIANALPELKRENMIAVPASFTSGWVFSENVLETAASYCIEAMNGVDYAADTFPGKGFKVKSVIAVHYPGDYGGDAAGGAKRAAQQNGLKFEDVPVAPGLKPDSPAIQKIIDEQPSLVMLSVGAPDTAMVVGAASKGGYRGRYIGSNPGWSPALLQTPAGPAFEKQYWQATVAREFATDSPGHAAMRKALKDVEPSDNYVSGWILSYPLKAALEQAAASGQLSRESLMEAVRHLKPVDYEGMLPPNDPGSRRGRRESTIGHADPSQYSGIRSDADFFEGPTSKKFSFDKPCYQT
ncbi:ABC transporter substrate-binding protein [Actinomadura barringtoniae]|uniref:ABC transporter substrate-binding protein n=1 Tax=Actinomadura barringtoniae TaxID=1427535 RepID=A0A939T2C0_9ACTN|nr:ABC transporter substrate-binding protein [Actinomadura barringtoniae]MBO2446348.1 ABC transporter substrate-binding protein [Actinomadura barringtoniae]